MGINNINIDAVKVFFTVINKININNNYDNR